MKSDREAKLELLKHFGWDHGLPAGKSAVFKEDKAIQSLTTQARPLSSYLRHYQELCQAVPLALSCSVTVRAFMLAMNASLLRKVGEEGAMHAGQGVLCEDWRVPCARHQPPLR